eukprot:scaffold4682_cov154-Pinguiococcus_pyrenoidosus.AAC.1
MSASKGTIDHVAEKAANEGIAVKIDTFSQSGGAAQGSPSASEIGSNFILTAHGLVDISPEATFQSTDWVVRIVVDAFVEHCLVNSVMTAKCAARTPLMTLMRRRPLEEDAEREGQRATLASLIKRCGLRCVRWRSSRRGVGLGCRRREQRSPFKSGTPLCRRYEISKSVRCGGGCVSRGVGAVASRVAPVFTQAVEGSAAR